MELKTDLNSQNKDKVKDAVKKVIASMTVGKDVSSLFTDVIKSMQTDNIELKKLVYLYIINYARSQPDKAILIVNTFQKDAMSSSPLIRALAIRTMGCIRVDRITEYLAEPLAKGHQGQGPVRAKDRCHRHRQDVRHQQGTTHSPTQLTFGHMASSLSWP